MSRSDVVDEMCDCGHPQCAHGGYDGHGGCSVPRCECQQYTWVGDFQPIESNHPLPLILAAIVTDFQEQHPALQLIAGRHRTFVAARTLTTVILKPTRRSIIIAITIRSDEISLFTRMPSQITYELMDPDWPRELNVIIKTYTDWWS